MNVIAKRPFVADAVFIRDSARWSDDDGEHADPTECLLLMVDGDNIDADVFTEKAWKEDGEPFCRREHGKFTEVKGGKVEFLPEPWIVKIDEREHWIDSEVLAACPRIYGVYVFDRRLHVHICSLTPSHELYFLGSQYDESPELQDNEIRRDEINSKVLECDAQTDEKVVYFPKADIDRFLQTEIHPGFLPPEGKSGGYRLTGIEAVTWQDAIREIEEIHTGDPL